MKPRDAVGWSTLLAAPVAGGLLREGRLRGRRCTCLKAAAEASVAAAAGGDLERILADSLDRLVDCTATDAGLVFLTSRGTRDLSLRAHRGLTEREAAAVCSLSARGGLLPQVLRSRHVLVVHDLSRYLPGATEGFLTGWLAPLGSRDVPQGLLVLAARRLRRPRDEETQLLAIVAAQIGTAVDNARLHQEAARKVQVQKHLNELAERTMSESEIDNILPMVTRSAKQLTGANAAAISLGEPEEGRGFCTITLPTMRAAGPRAMERVVHREVVRSRHPVVVEDYPAHDGALSPLVEAGLVSLVAVPIVYGDHAFGALTLFNFDQARRFAGYDISVAIELGRQAGIALENARLHQSTRFYVLQVTRAQEDERRRIARELHDETIQRLVVISRRLEGLSMMSAELPSAAMERIAALEELLSETMKGVRRFVQDLRPPMLDHLGLMASVEALATDLREGNGVEVEVRAEGTPRRLEPEEELVLFRIAQEALGNARRHSGATEVRVQMDFAEDRVRVSVQDNGCGFVPGKTDDYVSQAKLGLAGMNERARTLGGTLEICSSPGEGTMVAVEIPARRDAEEHLLPASA
jgi:two-component system, NarL family, sensor histidine kinase DegS